MRFLVIGAGSAGQFHCETLLSLEQDVYLYDEDVDRAAALATSTGAKPYIVDTEGEFDCAVVAVPANKHREVVEHHIVRGRKVVCEKPLALTGHDAQVIARYPADSVFIAESQAYAGDDSLDVKRMAENIEAGEFGWPVCLSLRCMTKYRPQPWFDDLGVGGGAFLEGGVHMLTVARVLFGEPCRWFGSTRSFGGGSGPDTGVFVVDYEYGHQLMLQIAWGVEGCLAGTCAPLSAQFGLFGPRKCLPWYPGDNHKAMWQHLLKCLAGEAQPVATLDHAAGAVEDVWKCYATAGVAQL